MSMRQVISRLASNQSVKSNNLQPFGYKSMKASYLNRLSHTPMSENRYPRPPLLEFNLAHLQFFPQTFRPFFTLPHIPLPLISLHILTVIFYTLNSIPISPYLVISALG